MPSSRTACNLFIWIALLKFAPAHTESCNNLQGRFPEEDVNDVAISYIQRHATFKGEKAVFQNTQDDVIGTALLSLTAESMSVSDPVGHDGGKGTQEKILYFCSLLLLALAVTIIYWPLGSMIILRILLYLLAGCTVTLTVKMVFSEPLGFNYPKLLTTLHLAMSALLGFGILIYRSFSEGKSIEIPTLQELWYKLMPLCLGMSYSLGCSNMALMYCSVSFAAIIGASTPFFSVLLMVILSMPFNWYLIFPVSGIVFGCMLTISGTLSFSLYGLILVLMGNLGRAIKAVLQQWIMTGEVKDKYDPITLLTWQCLICCPIMLLWTVLTEGAPAFTAMFQHAHPGILAAAIALSCLNAAALNALHIFVIKDLGAIGIQATSQLKQALTILGGVVMFGDAFTKLNVVGGMLVLLSAFWYTRAGKESKPVQNKGGVETSSEKKVTG